MNHRLLFQLSAHDDGLGPPEANKSPALAFGALQSIDG